MNRRPPTRIGSCEADRSYRSASPMNPRVSQKALMPLFGGFRSRATTDWLVAPVAQPEPQGLVLEQLPVPELALGLELI